MNPIRVALVNDYDVVVHGLMAMLRTYQDVIDVVELDTNRDVAQPVDIALYDTFASPQGNSEDVRRLLSNPLVKRVVVYSWVMEEHVISDALASGVAAYISKKSTAAELVKELIAVHNGMVAGRPNEKNDSVAVVGGDWPGREEGITQRESEVLALIVQGLSNAEIAERAHLSINSVKTYIRSCYRRIGATSRTRAALWAVEHGFRPDRTRTHDPDPDAANVRS